MVSMMRNTEIDAQEDNSERVSDFYGDTSPYGNLRYCIISKGLYERGGLVLPSYGVCEIFLVGTGENKFAQFEYHDRGSQ